MNSNSKGHYEEEKECGCKKRKEEETKVSLKCKAANPVSVTVVGAATPAPAVTTQLAKVTLNTGSFKDPCIRFDFATNLVVTAGATAANVALSFQLFKLCKGETIPEAIGNPWVYATITGALTDIISFIVCDCGCDEDCDSDDDCCSYYVAAITSTTSGTGTPTPTTTLAFNNPTLSALIVGK